MILGTSFTRHLLVMSPVFVLKAKILDYVCCENNGVVIVVLKHVEVSAIKSAGSRQLQVEQEESRDNNT